MAVLCPEISGLTVEDQLLVCCAIASWVVLCTSGIAVALKQAQSPAFKTYVKQVLDNAKALAEGLMKYGYTVVTGE